MIVACSRCPLSLGQTPAPGNVQAGHNSWTLKEGASAALQDFHHTAWTIENGLSAVFAVQQAPNGFLWLTTATGVFRFDGVRFESTDEVTNRQIHNMDIVTVFPSPSGGVWLTTRSRGLLLWKDNRVTNYPDRRCTPAQGLNGTVEDRD
jgi:ligand-binding sensor domain-containing protein